MVSESSSAGVSPMRRMSLLASIVNSRDFRQPENDPMSFRRATEQLAELGDEFSVEGARLQHVRHLGEGAFAKVELYKLRPKPSESMLTGDARQCAVAMYPEAPAATRAAAPWPRAIARLASKDDGIDERAW